MISTRMKISLDSNVFRNTKFLVWLKNNKNLFSISISIIVFLETFHWYNLKEISKKSFDNMIKSMEIKTINITKSQIELISNNGISSHLQFRHHIRDIIIATHAIKEHAIVITNNLKHYNWMENKNMTPEELVEYISSLAIN